MRNPATTPITLLTDFGARDAYPGAMKGVIYSLNPGAAVVDISHAIEPHAVVEAAWLLSSVARYYPPATVHVAVVDPGVGSGRKEIILETGGQFFVGPDNGIFSGVLCPGSPWRAFGIEDPRFLLDAPGRTFQGRDVFAPVAAYLSLGVDPAEFGNPLHRLEESDLVHPRWRKGELEGDVVRIDRFGNLITNISWEDLSRLGGRGCEVWAGGRKIGPLTGTYSGVGPGEILATIGGFGWLEIAVNRGRAADVLAIGNGAPVVVRKKEG